MNHKDWWLLGSTRFKSSAQSKYIKKENNVPDEIPMKQPVGFLDKSK